MIKGKELIRQFEDIVGVSYDMYFKYEEKYKEYKKRAKANNIVFRLTFEQFYLAVTSECYICGISGKTNEIGVDRLINTKGYTYYNIAGCCWNCNRMKSDMTFSQLKQYITRISPNHRLANKE